MRLGVATALVLCTQAVAECPTVDDLERGIRVLYADGTYDDYRQVPDSVILERDSAGDIGRCLDKFAHGLFHLEGACPQYGHGERYWYGVTVENMPVPGANQRMTVPWRYVGGWSYLEGRSVYITDSMQVFTFGECSFVGFNVRERTRQWESMVPPGMESSPEDLSAAFIYLSDLQIPVELWWQYENRPRIRNPNVVFILPIE